MAAVNCDDARAHVRWYQLRVMIADRRDVRRSKRARAPVRVIELLLIVVAHARAQARRRDRSQKCRGQKTADEMGEGARQRRSSRSVASSN